MLNIILDKLQKLTMTYEKWSIDNCYRTSFEHFINGSVKINNNSYVISWIFNKTENSGYLAMYYCSGSLINITYYNKPINPQFKYVDKMNL